MKWWFYIMCSMAPFTWIIHAQERLENDIWAEEADVLHQRFISIADVDFELAAQLLDALRKAAESKPQSKALYYYHNDTGYYHFLKHHADSSIYHYTKAYEVAHANNWGSEEIDSAIWIGNHHYFKGEQQQARQRYQQTLDRAIKLKHTDGIASAYYGLSSLEEDEEIVLRYLIKIDSLYQDAETSSPILANSYSSIARIYLNALDNREAALEYFDKAHRLSMQLNYQPGVLFTTKILGQIAYEEGRFQDAYRYFDLRLQDAIQRKDTINIAHELLELGKLDVATKQWERAEGRYLEALGVFEGFQDSVSVANSSIAMARLTTQQRNARKTKRYIDKARRYANKLNPRAFEADLLKVSVGYFELIDDYPSALRTQKKLDSLDDVLEKEKNTQAFLDLEQKYQAQEKSKQIRLLQSQNALVEAQKKNQRNLFLGGLALAVLLLIFLYSLHRNRQKTTRKLQEIDQAKSAFLTNISHEFRTPLTLIKGPVEDQLEKRYLDPVDRAQFSMVHQNVDRLEQLVQQLMDLSRLESGHYQLQITQGSIAQTISNIGQAFWFSCQEKQIEFELQIAADETSWFDMDAVEKITINLIGNAVKYTPEEGKIHVKGQLDGSHYVLVVSNSGTYISQQEQTEIFERFYQTAAHQQGTGIGLALTKELVEMHHGSITVRSNLEDGTCFEVRIGVGRSLFDPHLIREVNQWVPAEVATEAYSRIESVAETTEETPQLLIVDDHSDIRTYLESIFGTQYQVSQVGHAEAAFELAKKQVPDVIVSDVMMPGTDGYQLTQLLKTDPVTSHIPIVLLTAKAEIHDRVSGMSAGADAYIAKPFSSKILLATVQNLLENRRKLQAKFSQEVIIKPKEIAVSSVDEKFLDRLKQVVDTHLTQADFSAAIFSREMGMSRMQLHRKLKALLGQTTSEFLRTQRVQLAASLLKTGKINISEAGYAAGFNDPSYFAKCFRITMGCSPTEYLEQNA